MHRQKKLPKQKSLHKAQGILHLLSAMSISPSKLRPPFALDAEDDGSVFSTTSLSTTGFRTGGPKEARMHRVALLSKTKETEHLHSVRINNLPRTASAEKLLEEFKDFGEIGDVYIPINLKERKPAKDFAVIRFTDKNAADALLSKSTTSINGSEMQASPLSKQASFFSNNTGRLGISNEICISHVPEKKGPPEQHISLASVRSRAGYPWGSVRELKYLNPKPPSDVLEYHSIKLIDLPRHITESRLFEVFSQYGEIGVVRCPRPLIVTQQTKDANMGHAFVRYKDIRDLRKALDDMADEKIIMDGCVLKGEILPPQHWPTERTRRYY